MGVWVLNFTPVPTRQNKGFCFLEYSEWSKNHRVFSLYMQDYIIKQRDSEISSNVAYQAILDPIYAGTTILVKSTSPQE